MIPHNATHLVRGYDFRGKCLLETWHIGSGSMHTEVMVWRTRMKKGECSKIEITHLDERPTRTETLYS